LYHSSHRKKSMNNRVWITGANGFIGRHLAKAFINKKVIKFFKTNSSSLMENKSNFSFSLDEQGIKSAIDMHGYPDQVFHLAGAPTVGRSFQNPHEDFVSNVITTEILLDALSESKTHIIFASSAAVYGDNYDKGIKVDDKLLPKSPYGFNKIISEEIIKSYVNFFGLSATILRLFSIYGPGLYKQLLFDCCVKLKTHTKSNPLVFGGTGKELRDWLEVSDVVSAMQNLNKLDQGVVNTFNLGNGFAINIKDIILKTISAWEESSGLQPIFNKIKRSGDPFCLMADKTSLPPGFSPTVNIDDGIKHYVAWFKSENN